MTTRITVCWVLIFAVNLAATWGLIRYVERWERGYWKRLKKKEPPP